MDADKIIRCDPGASEAEEALRQALVEDLHDGFERVVHMYQGYIYTIAYAITRNHAFAEEAVSDTWLKAWQDILWFSKERLAVLHIRAWLGVIGRNAALDRVRKNMLSEELYQRLANAVVVQPKLASENPEDMVIHWELLQHLWRLVGQLPANYANVLKARYFYEFLEEVDWKRLVVTGREGRKQMVTQYDDEEELERRALECTRDGLSEGLFKQISLVLGLTEGTTRSLSHRGVKRLRKLLSESNLL